MQQKIHSNLSVGVNLKDSLGDGLRLRSILRVWMLADFFCQDNLQELATTACAEAVAHWVQKYGHYVQYNTLSTFPPTMTEHFVDALSMLYTTNHEGLSNAFKSLFLGTTFCGIHVLANNNEFQDLFQESHQFARDFGWEQLNMYTNHSLGGNTPEPRNHSPSQGLSTINSGDAVSGYTLSGLGLGRLSFQQEALNFENIHDVTCVKCRWRFGYATCMAPKAHPNLVKFVKRGICELVCWNCHPQTTLEEWRKA